MQSNKYDALNFEMRQALDFMQPFTSLLPSHWLDIMENRPFPTLYQNSDYERKEYIERLNNLEERYGVEYFTNGRGITPDKESYVAHYYGWEPHDALFWNEVCPVTVDYVPNVDISIFTNDVVSNDTVYLSINIPQLYLMFYDFEQMYPKGTIYTFLCYHVLPKLNFSYNHRVIENNLAGIVDVPKPKRYHEFPIADTFKFHLYTFCEDVANSSIEWRYVNTIVKPIHYRHWKDGYDYHNTIYKHDQYEDYRAVVQLLNISKLYHLITNTRDALLRRTIKNIKTVIGRDGNLYGMTKNEFQKLLGEIND